MLSNSTSSADRQAEYSALIARIALGDRSSFERLYRLSAPNLYAQLVRILRRTTWAEEVLQETFIKIWQHAGSYQSDRSAATTWLSSIARNGAFDRLDRRDTAEVELTVEAAEAMVDATPGPLEAALGNAESHRIHDCVEQLPAQLRQSIALAFFHGLSHSEVAERLQQPLGTVKTWIRRALGTLKACVGK